MSNSTDYPKKFAQISQQTSFRYLPAAQQSFTKQTAHEHMFTMQELRQFIEIALDLISWNESDIVQIWTKLHAGEKTGRDKKKELLRQLSNRWHELKGEQNRYTHTIHPLSEKPTIATANRDEIALGYCPVASEKTRCCNLLTLDAVERCGFDCSYCSIQSFYHGNQVIFDSNFADNLSQLKLDPEQTYHIGTGQSSDSLMWGNKHGILAALINFAKTNPNVILELKTKSANISYLSKVEIPPNIICTWSLNTQTIIDNEEHKTASLQQRIDAARKIADMGVIVGFHFHPIVHYSGWRDEYHSIYSQLQDMFTPKQVAMISIGTLTFIKPVVKKIRERNLTSKILKMPMIEAAGKLSYPEETKLKLFSHAYDSFCKEWQDNVFFYLCMENHSTWKQVFGYEYQSNSDFEQDMKSSYLRKIEQSYG
jgi:spore photoproduct lyase